MRKGVSCIDLSDQKASRKTFLLKDVKWNEKLLARLILELELFNGLMILNQVNKTKLEINTFRIEFIDQFVQIKKDRNTKV